ncbi:NAD-dependent epimerase/dehydratase family protein [Vagococcus entomophilus]|uniref:NAD-dependent epimerase/dehydratase domain-containing protein n=1 Tax=Vagococcus entomophilus TaxID=1160095 RepID=A0A430AJ02_9ENTE|nr:NAD-dependent epimerase/dehydratase family protein [Vagococcus entomophilus]RSU07897.1 hypothetical protein CBF30_01265 [Vagococcus entomophilus]
MNYLILGSSGFIGSNLVKKMTNSEDTVRLFDRHSNKMEVGHSTRTFISGEFGSEYDFDQLTEGIDVVFHLISTTVPASTVSLKKEIEDNVLGTIKLLDACVKNKVKKIVFISSGGTVYGKGAGIPFLETDETNPINSYGIQKLAIEKYIQLYYHLYNLDYRIIRLANPFGPGQNPNGGQGVVTAFCYKMIQNEPITIYGDGNVVRDYIYIDDAIDGILRIAQYEGENKIFNLGSDKGYSIREIVAFIEKVADKKFQICYEEARNVDVPYNVLNTGRYMEIAQTKKMTSILDGIEKLLSYFSSL